MDKESAAYKNGEFEDIFKEAELENMAAEDVVAYSESKLKLEDDLAAMDNYYKKGREEGREEGILISAKKMLDADLDVEFVHKILGLSVEEIKKLKNKNL